VGRLDLRLTRPPKRGHRHFHGGGRALFGCPYFAVKDQVNGLIGGSFELVVQDRVPDRVDLSPAPSNGV
jgi:hypothetical protein